MNFAVTQVAPTPDGRIFAIINSTTFLRLNPDGSLDSTSNFTGVIVGLNGVTNILGTIQAIEVQPDGRILIGATGFVNGSTSSFLQRLNPSGSNDSTFPSVNLGNYSAIRAIRALADGRVMVAATTTGITVQRFTAAGLPDPTFTPLSSTATNSTSVAFTADGRTWLGGSFTNLGSVGRNQLARLNADAPSTRATIPAPACSRRAALPPPRRSSSRPTTAARSSAATSIESTAPSALNSPASPPNPPAAQTPRS